jgi:voltage-gated sodium channel
MVQLCERIADSKWFHHAILALILLSGILVGFETYPQFQKGTTIGDVFQSVQDVILWIFVLEAAIKIAAFWPKPWRYFQNPWNVFDFTIVAICFLPGHPEYAMVFRMARLLRAVRLLTALPRLQVLVNALLKSIPSLGYVGILLLLHFYIYAVLGSFLFSQNDPIRFGNLQKSMMTLFEVLTLEGWNDVFNTQWLGSDVTYSEEWRNLPVAANRVSIAHPIAASAYFVTFIMLGTMIMLNLFTGVIISSMQEAQEHQDEQNRTEEEKAEDRIREIEDKGFMTLREEFEVIALHLREVSDNVAALREQTNQFRMDASRTTVPSPTNPPGVALDTPHTTKGRELRRDERHTTTGH